MKDIWYAIDYQDRRINKLVEENQDYKTRLTNTEYKLNVEVKEVRKDIQGLKTHLESIVDIVNVFQTHFQQLRQNSKKQRPSTSPKLSTGVANRSWIKKQAFLSTKPKTKKVIKKKTLLNHKTPLTDTESSRMTDLVRKTYFNPSQKKPTKTKPTYSAQKVSKTKDYPKYLKTVSNSRSPLRAESQSSGSNHKIKSTLASTELWRSQALRNSRESMSISSEKPKAAYFRNTLDSHNKIGPDPSKNK